MIQKVKRVQEEKLFTNRFNYEMNFHLVFCLLVKNNHVEFKITHSYFYVTIYNSINYCCINDNINENTDLSKNTIIILFEITSNPLITRKELSNRIIKELKDKGYLSEKNSNKNGRWIIKK